jgi:hypothetical protein
VEGVRVLETIDGKRVNAVPHRTDFDALLRRLGAVAADGVREYLDAVIAGLPPDTGTGLRTFNSSQLGRALTPWPEPLAGLYHGSREFLGQQATEHEVEDRAALWFGLFVWERIMEAEELWAFYDPNLSSTDPNREPMGKVYFERDSED